MYEFFFLRMKDQIEIKNIVKFLIIVLNYQALYILF
jgi:hypothetical protein